MLEILLTLAVIASTGFTSLLLCLPSQYVKHSPPKATGDASDKSTHEPKISVQVLVLGDIGRSPRMSYHAMSIAKHGGRVDLIGYQESALHPGLLNHPLITIHPLSPPPPILHTLQRHKTPFLILGPLKVLHQSWTLFRTLSYRTRPARWLLVQNPPSIPTLLLAFLVCFLRNTHLLIDWHNYGWSILAGTKGPTHPFVKISKIYECLLGEYAPTANFTVSDAMTRQLRNPPYSIRSPIFTLHDRPAVVFQPITDSTQRHAVLSRIPETKPHVEDITSSRTRLLVSSTSWTPDEDFSLLLSSFISYAKLRKTSSTTNPTPTLPPLVAIITGKGPQKQHYLEQISILQADNQLDGVTVETAWLSTEDYAALLACADLGICLHMSSSGVDLPMKVVDMFGAGLPVAGYSGYESWEELVTEGVNGRGFVTSGELTDVLVELFAGRDGEGRELELARLRRGAREQGRRRWDDEWDGVAGRVLGLVD